MSFRRIEESLTTDNFGQLIADGRTNDSDIGSHYPFNSERWRLYKNGNRQYPIYGGVSGFSDNNDDFTISPAGGEAWKLRTAERYRYRVGYVIKPSLAFQVSQALQGNDIVTVSYGTADLNNVGSSTTDLTTGSPEGWVLKFTSDDVEFAMYRNGVKKAGTSVQNRISRLPTTHGRIAFEIDWYNVGSSKLIETFTDDGEQENPTIAEIGADDDRGPEKGNYHVEFAVRPDSSTSNLELKTGSVAFQTLGSVAGIDREKGVFKRDVSIPNTDTWEPVHAFRVDPNKKLVNVELATMDIVGYSVDDDVELVAVGFDSDKTDASSFSTPDNLHDPNTALQATDSVTQIPNDSGTQEDPDSSTDPGGYTLTSNVLSSEGKKDQAGGLTASSIQKEKKTVYEGDVVVILARSSTSGDVSFKYSVTENW